MTTRVTVSLPDDLGAWLAEQPNASATVANALRATVNEEESRRARRRASARQWAAWYANKMDTDPEFAAAEREALDSQWDDLPPEATWND